MRIPSRRRSARRPLHPLSGLLALASLAQAIDFKAALPANLDFSNLGRMGVAGDFNGISIYEFEGQNARSTGGGDGESLLGQLPNGALASIVTTDATIRAMCTFTLSTGAMQGVVIGGNFTSLDGTESTAIALFNPNTTGVTPLAGLEGEVNAVYCDQERDTVYVGGNFKGANSTNAIAWYGSEGWTNLPFAGFNGPVEAITKAPNGHIIFGGTFTGLGNASAPSEPDGQSINLSTANITAINTIDKDGFDDPKNIVCASGSDEEGSAWLVQDDTPGFWDAAFAFGFEPTKLRLWNTHQDGRGTKTFRFTAFPISGIMNLTYLDPATGQNSTCTSECPLTDDTGVEYQDFHFVNRVGMNRFQLGISDWYGDGAGLAGIELFQDNIFSYAVKDFNEPTCRSIEYPSTATATGPWKESPSLQSNSKYLTVQVDGDSSSDSASVVFTPNIRESGNYSVNMYTPGCQADETCETRGRVNITGVISSGSDDADFTTSLYQTNSFDKYDQIYFGYIEKTSDTFKPSVTLSPLAGQDIRNLTIVAQRVGFTLINSTGGLNGLFDFDPDQAVIDTSTFENSSINKLGASFDRNTGVKSLVTFGETIYVGGNFTSDEHRNIVAISNNKNVKSLDGGLNGQVLDMYLDDKSIYVGGEFSNTLTKAVDGLSHVAVYDIDSDTFKPLGGGVDGTVRFVVPLQVNITEDTPETVITFSGSFSQCNEFDNSSAISVEGFAVWVPSAGTWLQNVDGPVPSYSGILTAAILDLPTDESIFAGSISSAQMSVNGAATVNDDGLGKFPVDIEAQAASSQVSRRDVFADTEIAGVQTGIFYDEDDRNLTVLAGHFTAQTKDGSIINNLVIIDGDDNDSVSGLGSGISEDSTFVTVDIRGSVIFAGGKVTGKINDNDVSGIIAYDIESKSFGNQPPGLDGGNGTVAAISVRPDSAEVYVGGSFDHAGALACPGICTYNADSDQWTRPGTEVAGDVYSLVWSSKSKLIVGGNMKANGSDYSYLAIYDAKKQSWTSFPGSGDIPGPVHVITPGSSDNDQIWITGVSADDGSVFLLKYDGDKWLTAKPTLSSDTVVQGLQVFRTTESHDDSDLLDNKQVVMLTGSISIPDFGIASAAIYNGTTFEPYILTTGSNNGAGSIAKIFTQKDNFFSSDDDNMPLVFVILIGLAIALALILLLVLVGIILDRLRKKREGYVPAPTSMYDRGSGIHRIPPRELLRSLGKGRPDAPRV